MPAKECYRKNKEKYRKESREYYYNNRQKCLDMVAKYAKENPETIERHRKKHRAKNRKHYSEYSVNLRRAKSGFSEELFVKRAYEQDNRCAICNQEFDESIHMLKKSADHCHKTQTPRGILCRQCNILLGNAKDNIEILQNAIEYLHFWKRTV